MAPRKPTSPAKPRRTTRARAGETDITTTAKDSTTRNPSKRAAEPTTTRARAIESKSRITKKPVATATKLTRGGRATTRSVKSAPTPEVEDETDSDEAEPMVEVTVSKAPSKPRATRNTTTSTAATGLAAAPRRRIKVTPLVSSEPQPDPVPETIVETKPEKKSSTRSKKEKVTTESEPSSSARTKRSAATAKLDEPAEPENVPPEVKKRGRTRAAQTEEPKSRDTTKTASTTAKSRGRPKKDKVAADPVETDEPKIVTTRQTRARSGSVNAPILGQSTVSVIVPAKKKVTFELMPGDNEDEKENNQPKANAKGKAAKGTSKKSEPAATGMRARPIRKPAATRTTKATRGAVKTAAHPTEEIEVEEVGKKMPRALTPKKITQVAKAMFVESDDEAEDELAGAKTPVRDLSMSPRRGLTPSATRPLSPSKSLDFATAFKQTSPGKLGLGASLGMLSPARRMPASPFKDSLKESPRRAPEGVTVFRAQIPDPHNAAFTALSPSKNKSLLQHSPKRGLADKIVFPPSAMKSRATPLKASFLASPARRLFSASKQKTPARLSPPKKLFEKENATPLADVEEVDDAAHGEVEVSSHFRSSVSPQRSARVYRLSEDELAQRVESEINFEESVLDVRSPLKMDKVKPVVTDASASLTDDAVRDAVDDTMEEVVLETPGRSVHDEDLADIDNDETIMDPALEVEESSDLEEGLSNGVSLYDLSADESTKDQKPSEESDKKPRMSNVLFSRLRQIDDDSEDELAGEQTPDNRMLRPASRTSMSAANIRSRLSTGFVPQSASRNLGFTPLTAQVQGWRAGSPEKRPSAVAPRSQGLFSPLARMHVEGSVEFNRPDTPGSKRKSFAGRASLAPSMAESPMKPDFFAEGMAAQDFEEQVEAEDEEIREQHQDLHDFVEDNVAAPATIDTATETVDEEAGSQDVADPAELTTDLVNFTKASDTAMVDFQALANEAKELAALEEDAGESTLSSPEAENNANAALENIDKEHSLLSSRSAASEEEQNDASEVEQEDEDMADVAEAEVIEEEQSMLSTSSGSFEDENAAPVEALAAEEFAGLEADASAADESFDDVNDNMESSEEDLSEANEGMSLHAQDPDNGDDEREQTAERYEVTATSIEVTPVKIIITNASHHEDIDFNVTPVRPDPALPRQIHTVVSKVPLAPEGAVSAVSPLKIQRKRARSVSSSTPQGVKRRSLGLDFQVPFGTDVLATPRGNGNVGLSPQRRARSAAPSPANSLASGLTTPGQIHFALDDFGDSTLDGIEMPEDELFSDEINERGIVEQDESVMTIGSALFRTPIAPSKRSIVAPASVQSNASATPSYALSTRSSKGRSGTTPRMTPSKAVSRTPAMAAKTKTPSTALKSKLAAKTPQTSRTPLTAVDSGVLHGVVVHTDIHTSEGMDASAFYIDILTSMGARVVREWRWNPRASTATIEDDISENQAPSTSPGITHVVYKDGGKRTLEKVRSAKGQVLCIGVGWVLDCVREGKWLDEAAYAVDQSILPRGGSRRRKSMEPRMLVNDHGFLSASRDRRSRSVSVGVEALDMSEDLKLELINTPVRGSETFEHGETETETDNAGTIADGAFGDETEISSTYASPTAATVGGGGDTANVGLLIAQHDAMRTPGSVMSRRHGSVNVRTPQSTSLAVDYDPRTAATPLTPYLVAKGRELIQKSAPPKQSRKGIFDQDEDDSILAAKENQNVAVKKFQVKGGKKVFDGRRKTLGVPGMAFKPVVGSPLGKE